MSIEIYVGVFKIVIDTTNYWSNRMRMPNETIKIAKETEKKNVPITIITLVLALA